MNNKKEGPSSIETTDDEWALFLTKPGLKGPVFSTCYLVNSKKYSNKKTKTKQWSTFTVFF